MEHFECFCPHFTLPLLYTCHIIYDEIIHILYGMNTFMIWRPFSQLRPLTNLSSAALALLSDLQIGLGSSGIPDIEAEWAAACNLLATKITPYRLSLSFYCYIRTTESLRAIVDPLRTLPTLKHCAVRLYPTFGQKTSTALDNVAKDVALGLTHVARTAQQPFPLMRLPKEIRYQILGMTDLVAPWDVTQWESHGMVISSGKLALRSNRCCGKCMDYLAIGCNCEPRGCAYATTCACYHFPHGLFRSNKQLCYESRKIFYSQNRFVFSGEALKTLQFLQTRTPEALSSIRRLDLQFREIPFGDMNIPVHSYGEWQNLITFVATHLNLSNLFLSVDAGSMWDEYHYNPLYFDANAGEKEQLDMYKRFMVPLRQLRGLKSFHVFLSCCHEYEIEAEKEVMGLDYDSSLDGKIPLEERWPQFPHGVPDKRTLQRLIGQC